MKDPIKVIHKFKNNNRRIQYQTYIFIGQLIDNNIKIILNKIQNKDLFNSFMIMTKKDIKTITEYYGKKWYKYFFNTYHIKNQINIIKKTINKKKQLISKFGKDWYNNNIERIKKKKIEY